MFGQWPVFNYQIELREPQGHVELKEALSVCVSTLISKITGSTRNGLHYELENLN